MADGLEDGRLSSFESQTPFTATCHSCGNESDRIWRCTACGREIDGSVRVEAPGGSSGPERFLNRSDRPCPAGGQTSPLALTLAVIDGLQDLEVVREWIAYEEHHQQRERILDRLERRRMYLRVRELDDVDVVRDAIENEVDGDARQWVVALLNHRLSTLKDMQSDTTDTDETREQSSTSDTAVATDGGESE